MSHPAPSCTRALCLAALSLTAAALASCAKGSTEPGDIDAGISITTPILEGGMVSGDGSTMFGNLAPPWQFQAGGTPSYKDPTIVGTVKDQFGGPVGTTNKPVIVYPLESSFHPNNLLLITFQWKQGSATNKFFKIEVTADGQRFDLYVPCKTTNGQCLYKMPLSEWLAIAGHQQASFVVTGTDGAGGPVTSSDPVTIQFSNEPVLGGLYYWASSLGMIKRATFGSSQAVNYIAPKDATLGLGDTPCVACHSVSRDGKAIAFSVTSPKDSSGSDQPWGVFVVPTDKPSKPMVAPPMQAGTVMGSFGSNVALNPDGSFMAVNGKESGETLFLDVRNTTDFRDRTFSAKTGDAVFKPYDMAIMPEWSPDGNTLAASLVHVDWGGNQCYWDHLTCNGTIGLFAWNGSKLATAVPLIKNADGHDQDFHFYPTWSPDGKWIAFVSQVGKYDVGDAGSADNNWGRQSSYDSKNGVLRMVPADLAGAPYVCPGPKCVELINATQYSWAEAIARNGKGSHLPKFAPFAQAGGTMLFITYTSRIDYGFTSGDIRQLWMSAIDTTKITDSAGSDPSHVPFWVPYQSTEEKNVEPFWTEVLSCSKDPKGGCQGCVGAEQCLIDQKNNCHCEVSVR
jgi:hypothetical protein